MSKDEIIAKLAALYRVEYDWYFQLSELAKEALHEGDTKAYEAINRRAVNRSCFLDGMRTAAEALGVGLLDKLKEE